MNRRYIAGTLAGTVTGALLLLNVRAAVDGTAKLTGPAVVELGEIDPGARLSTVIALRNEGWRRIRIRGVHASCSCVSATVNPDAIATGGSANLSLDVNAVGGPGRSVGVDVLVHSTAVNSPHIVKITYKLRTGSPLSAQRVYFGTINRDSLPTSRTVVFHANVETRAEMHLGEHPRCSVPFVTAAFSGEPEDGKLGLAVRISPDAPCGEILTDVRMCEINDGVAREHALKVSALVHGKVSANPPMLWMREGEEAYVTVKARDVPDPVTILSWKFYPEAGENVDIKSVKTNENSATLIVTPVDGVAASGKWLVGTIVAAIARGKSDVAWEWISIPVFLKNESPVSLESLEPVSKLH